MATTKAKTPEPDAPDEPDESSEAPVEPSKARKAFLAGEMAWNEFVEAENG